MAFSSEATDAPPPYATPGPAGPWMLAKTTTTTKVTTTTTETHFFPLFRRKPNTRQEESAAASLRRSIDREKALPLPPADSSANSHALGIGLPVAHKSTDRDITPRAADRDITPTAPVPIIVPASPRASRIAPPRDIRRVRSSGTIRDSHANPTRRSEQNMRDVFLASKPLPVPLSAPPQHTSLPDLQPPRTRQPAISSPSLNSPGPSSARAPGPSAILGAGFNQIGAGLGARPTTLWVGDGSGTSTWGTGVPQGWNPAQGWEREQGRLGWETNQAEFGVRMGQTQAYHSLGSRERERDRERERERRPSAPSLHVQSLKGKGKERERDSLDPDPSKEKEGGKRGLLSRRPSFWRKNKPKDYTDRRPSASQQDGAVPQKSSSDATRQDATVDLNRGADPKRSHERVALVNTTKYKRRRPTTISKCDYIPPFKHRPTPGLSLPTVRPMTPLFSEFGVYRASVDFVAAGGPGMMAALAERLAEEGGAGVGETIPEGVEAKNESSAPIPVPGTATPPRRRLTGTSSLGRATSWRRSLVESAENWRRSIIGSGGEPAAPEDVLSGSPASNSPIPWVNSSPRGSPVPRRSMQESAPASGRESPARRSRRQSPTPASRQGSPARNLMSPVGGARVTFGDDSGRPRLASLVTKAKGEKNEGQRGSTAAGSGNASLRRARSTSRLTSALSPSRSRSFSLFGPRPSSAGQPQTQQSRHREEQAQVTGVSTPGHTHPSAFSPVTEPGLSLTLSPPMMATNAGNGAHPFPSPSVGGSHTSIPGTPIFTHASGSQFSLGGNTSSVGHAQQQNGYLGSSSTFTAGSPNGSRASSILLRSPLRPRSSTNPPLLRRLSGVFGSAGGAGRNEGLSPGGLGFTPVPTRPGSSKGAPVPKRVDDETPEVYLNRLLEGVSKTEIAGVLASKSDEFHVAALQLYLSRFNFVFDPLDIALRRLLMDLSLPKETQQIDRVMEAFAKRYNECNPGLFVSEDHAYILAFSLMMLHTDAFNKSNKNKMTKADYVKNTRMGGIPPEVLDCYFDNIVFAPFIFIEDPTDVNGQRGFVPEALASRGSITGASSINSTGTLLASKPKIDPYYIITQNLLDPLRVPVDQYIPTASPFSFTGTADCLNAAQLRHAFASNTQLEIAGIGVEPVRIGVNKSGLLSRKDDLLEGGRRAGSRKWRRWAVVLTGSQLLFFREASWAALAPGSTGANGSNEPVQQAGSLKPEEVISLKDVVALYDVSYDKYNHVFRFIMPNGRQQLMQAANEQDMNEWISRINYASALKSAGVRVREPVMNMEESRATGVAAAVSHVRDRRLGKLAAPPSAWVGSIEPEEDPSQVSPLRKSSENRSNVSSEVELDAIVEPTDGGMKDTFDEIKAELAASYNTYPRSCLAPPRQTGYRALSLGAERPSDTSLPSEDGMRARMSTRAEVVTSKINDLKSKISTTEQHLQNELRVARNFAVLAPFQLATRNRIRVSVESLAKRIQVIRMDMAKIACHRDILVADLAAEEEEREQLKMIALQAAREQLSRSVPRMTLSVHDNVPEEAARPELRPSPAGSDASASASASAAWSFHSAADYPDPAEDLTLTRGKNDTSLTTPETEAEQLVPSTPRKSDVSLRPRPSFAASSRSGASHVSSSGNVHGSGTDQGGQTSAVNEEDIEEQAEVWHATRAGRRVSLVELPPAPEGRKLSDLFKKRRNTNDTIGETGDGNEKGDSSA
ncbi:Sec7 guanine nucleotide exchange factor [Ceratobasidium sp. AG-Ba]|nr:Sec7 guanine nucleotide exchange factor [Ceratobasidium sp. AG-Ba]